MDKKTARIRRATRARAKIRELGDKEAPVDNRYAFGEPLLTSTDLNFGLKGGGG